MADRHDLRQHIQFDTEIEKLVFDEAAGLWTLRTGAGEEMRTTFCILATGCLSQFQKVQQLFEGFSDFRGATYDTGHWPHAGKFGGASPHINKRVAVIGTGSSGIQCIAEIAKTAKHLTVFQRTAAWTIPARNCPMDLKYAKSVKDNYSTIRKQMALSPVGYLPDDIKKHPVFVNPGLSILDVSEAESNSVLEALWQQGGLIFTVSYFDVMRNEKANAIVADFVRKKIRGIVKCPEVAERLSPKSFIGCKRLTVDTDYWATYNRENVSLVDISANGAGSTPIVRMTEKGILTSDGCEHEVDVIVFATGYDAMTGALLNIDIVGEGGQTIQDAWRDGPRTYMGLGVSGFPNLFTVTGPGSPSVFTNMMTSIDQHVEWIAQTLEHMRSKGFTRIVPERSAEDDWMQYCRRVAADSLRLHPSCVSWYTGDNIKGKPRAVATFSGGLDRYTHKLEQATSDNYRGYCIS